MKILIKGYYGYKNLGDELIVFWLLNRIEESFNPNQIDLICGDAQRMESRLIEHKHFFPPILKKINCISKPNTKEQIQIALGSQRNKYDLIIFGGGQVLDENRKFPYNGRNLPLLYEDSIRKRRFVLVGGLGTDHSSLTKQLQKNLIQHAKYLILRDSFSYDITKKYLNKHELHKVELFGDLSLPLLEETKDYLESWEVEDTRDPYLLINLSPLCDWEESLKKIKETVRKHPQFQPIYFPCSMWEDMQYYTKLQEHLPQLELFDWTKAGVAKTVKLLYFAKLWIGARLHFLYPLKFFGKEIEVLAKSHKNQIALSDIDSWIIEQEHDHHH